MAGAAFAGESVGLIGVAGEGILRSLRSVPAGCQRQVAAITVPAVTVGYRAFANPASGMIIPLPTSVGMPVAPTVTVVGSAAEQPRRERQVVRSIRTSGTNSSSIRRILYSTT